MQGINNNCLNLSIRIKFHEKFHELLTNYPNVLKNIWIVNEVIFPLKSDIKKKKRIKTLNESLKYGTPESDFHFYSSLNKMKWNQMPNDETLVSDKNFSLKIKENIFEAESKSLNVKKHVHTFFAFNKECEKSLPFIIFPQGKNLIFYFQN